MQGTKRPNSIYFKDLDIFKLEGIEEITETNTKKADRYVILNQFNEDSVTFTIVDKRNKTTSVIIPQKGHGFLPKTCLPPSLLKLTLLLPKGLPLWGRIPS